MNSNQRQHIDNVALARWVQGQGPFFAELRPLCGLFTRLTRRMVDLESEKEKPKYGGHTCTAFNCSSLKHDDTAVENRLTDIRFAMLLFKPENNTQLLVLPARSTVSSCRCTWILPVQYSLVIHLFLVFSFLCT